MQTIREFLRRLGHPVALVGTKPLAGGPRVKVIWPAEQHDPPDEAAWLSHDYYSVYSQLNPLRGEMLTVQPEPWVSVRDSMIARRTRLLIDVDGHDLPKEIAREQKDEIKERYGTPLIETDSGNGYGLIYEIDLPNDADSKFRVQHFLQRLKADFPCVDAGCFNAARLTRVIGTPNRSIVDGSRIKTELA